MKYSLVIPVYNSSDSLVEITGRIEKTLQSSYEIIFIDDGSINVETRSTLKKLAEKKEVSVSILSRNFGKAGAVLCGFSLVKGDYVVTMDDDLQHAPEDILKLADKSNHDVVIGSFKQKKHSLWKSLSSKIKNYLDYKLAGKPKGIQSSPFKLMKRSVVDGVLQVRSAQPHISSMIYYVTNDIVNVPVSHHERKHDKSAFGIKKSTQSFFNLLFNNSPALLKYVAGFGLVMAALSIGAGLYFLIKKLTVGIDRQGWTSLFLLVSFTSGVILFSMGIIGEYLVRIINGTERKPPFIIKEKWDE